MDNSRYILEQLKFIDPATLDYQEWVNVGMALKFEGLSCDVWDEWSRSDPKRYHPEDCEKKWETFNGASSPVTGGTIYQMAVEGGYIPNRLTGNDEAMDWDDEIAQDPLRVIEGFEIEEFKLPTRWEPKEQITEYLKALFNSDEFVGYVTESWKNDDGRALPKKGSWTRTAGELLSELSQVRDNDIGAVFGDYNTEAGAWIRFNPLDGKGIRNDNVTDYRYALIESDNTDLNTQYTVIKELELPVAALVYSGGKSIHAIVKVEAADAEEYRKRVQYLYNVCKKNGLDVDKQNKNPSRLSRMPGVIRKGKKQYLLDTNIGKESWSEWQEWIESINDDLPDPESLSDSWDDLPELSPPLIDGILRQGHKMLIAGPSKAGKSFALIELTIAIAEGRDWYGYNCAQGRVLYVNLELDKASCLHRFADVYKAHKWRPSHIGNIDIWNLRGKASPMDKLSPKLIRRAVKKGYIAVIIDPIYKVLTGDENSAEHMSKFCNEFDKICAELGCAVIYCHHHSKGAQGGKKSMDRASGSGVFARDPDAMLDLIELEITDNIQLAVENKRECAVYAEYLRRFYPSDYDDIVSPDDAQSVSRMRDIAAEQLPPNSVKLAKQQFEKERQNIDQLSAWRIDMTLREFPKPKPLNLWFEYPIHIPDREGILTDAQSDETRPGQNWKKNFSKKQSPEQKAESRRQDFETHFYSLRSFNESGVVSLKKLCEQLGKSERTVRRWIEDDYNDDYRIIKGNVEKLSSSE